MRDVPMPESKSGWGMVVEINNACALISTVSVVMSSHKPALE